ncbi:hypothetical protein [Bradyrhizobium sp. BWC-3-1]|uniref:hypothetical protein n=1 Tax=Bradyrhizobium sp. BWC-3-1 TaxID=3080012 RepID=UPI00293E316D|nr:hypothetical protein [Bradyrhizobium sp. BWC-3-1]WOH61957.1 hypothetical protein RX329_18420 [Bradyrhizobium sp. BWC-3-1]
MRSFSLNDEVKLSISGERGHIIGMATYAEHVDQFQVHYVDAHGAARTDWFTSGQLAFAD